MENIFTKLRKSMYAKLNAYKGQVIYMHKSGLCSKEEKEALTKIISAHDEFQKLYNAWKVKTRD